MYECTNQSKAMNKNVAIVGKIGLMYDFYLIFPRKSNDGIEI